jgi:hypothetical protein
MSGNSTPSSPTHAAHVLAALSSYNSGTQLSAESICPLETLDLLIDDFFTYIHPLCPFPHEPSFREAWRRREDLSNNSFLALLASMVGALVASFPRRPRLHIKAQKKENLFPNHMSLVHRCQKIVAAARGPGYLENENLSIYDAATSYFLALITTYTLRWRLGRLYFGECLTILRTLGLHKSKEQGFTRLGTLHNAAQHDIDFGGSREDGIDNITSETGRRVFWTMFVTVRTIQQLGAAFSELIMPPPTVTDPYPPLPAEVDDFCIFTTHIEPQPPGLLPKITGFNANVRVFCSCNSLATMEMAWGIDAVVDWDRQRRVMHESLRRCKSAVSDLPPELTVDTTRGPFESAGHQNGHSIYPNLSSANMFRAASDPPINSPPQNDLDRSQHATRQTQYEIQKANIYASSLATRSYIIEKYWNLWEARNRIRHCPDSPGITAAGIDQMLPQQLMYSDEDVDREMQQERESIVRDLLIVLSSINEVNMEPNGHSFVSG